MRYEGKHRLLKLISNVTSSRINLSKSIMTRYNFMLSQYLQSLRTCEFRDVYEVGPNRLEDSGYRWVIYRGIKYSIGNVVKVDEQFDLLPVFGVVQKLCVENDVLFIENKLLSTKYYNLMLSAYVVYDSDPQVVVNLDAGKLSSPLVNVKRKEEWFVANVGLD